MPVAYSYMRFSTAEQGLGDSARRQLERAEAYAAQHGLTLDTSLRDEGVSGFKGANRTTGAFGRFLALVRAGRIAKGSYLLIENFDRLSREPVLPTITVLNEIVQAGVNVVTLSNGKVWSLDALSGDGMWEAIVEIHRAHGESKRKSDLVGSAWQKKRAKARESRIAQTRMCPGWIEKVGAAYRLIPERAEIVSEIFRRLAAGDGARLIAADLNRRGVPTWGVRKRVSRLAPKPEGPSKWHASYIQKMLATKAVVGVGVVRGGEAIDGYFPRVISDEAYWAAKVAAEARRSGPAPNRGPTVRNLLQGLGKCVRCGSTMVYVDKGQRSSGPYLQCAGVTDGSKCDNRFKWDYRRLEIMLPFGIGAAGRSRIAEAVDPDSTLADRIARAHAQVADAERRWKTLLSLLDADAAGENMKQELQIRDAALTAARKALAELEGQEAVRVERQGETASIIDDIRRFRGDPAQRRMIAQRLLEYIARVDFDGGEAVFRFKDGTMAKAFGVEIKSPNPNRGWFVDGKRKLGDGEWTRALPGAQARRTARKKAAAEVGKTARPAREPRPRSGGATR